MKFKTGLHLWIISLIFGLSACSGRTDHIEILASVKADAPGNAWTLESDNFNAIGSALFGPGQHVVVTALSDRSATEPAIFDDTVAAQSLLGDNDMVLHDKANVMRRGFVDALGQLAARRTGRPRTEIIEAVVAAAERFRDDAPGAGKSLVIFSTGFQQSGILNMGDASLSLRRATPAVLKALRRRNYVPDLSGIKVCMAGITAGDKQWADANEAFAIRDFWDQYFRAAGAQLIGFSPALSKTCTNAVHKIDLLAGSNN
jgi:hypothetical protein